MLGNSEGQIILAGDFNEVMDPFFDQSSHQTHLLSKGWEAIHNVVLWSGPFRYMEAVQSKK